MNSDFTGFSFDGIHSSFLGLVRISDESNYQETLQPNFENKVNDVPGYDGQFYFGVDYHEKEIIFKVAFDSVTEKQFRQIVALFSTKKICPLIFDERPYKMYNVKLAEPISLNYICFDEPLRILDEPREGIRVIDRKKTEEGTVITRETVYPYKFVYENNKKVTQRIYKGVGEINFVCMDAMAKAPFKILDDYLTMRSTNNIFKESNDLFNTINYNNVNEWSETSGILNAETYLQYNIDTPTVLSLSEPGQSSDYNIKINVYNPGDIDAPFLLYLPYYGLDNMLQPDFGDYIRVHMGGGNIMLINPFTSKKEREKETGVIINSENYLIEGVLYNSYEHTWYKTGSVYNEYIAGGTFTKILKQDLFQRVKNDTELGKQSIYINCKYNDITDIWIKYNYLYY